MQELTQVINPQQIDYETIYFKDGIQYTLWSETQKPKSMLYEFKPLVGQVSSALIKLSNNNLICQDLFIYKQRPASELSFLQATLF